MKWDVKHDRAKKVLNHFLDNAGYWTEVENLTDGLTEEEIREVNAEVTTMIQSITKRYKLDVMLPANPVVEEKPQEEERGGCMSSTAKLTAEQIENLAKEIREFLLEHGLWQDVDIYFNGKRFTQHDPVTGKYYYNDREHLIEEENQDPRTYFEYVNPDHILSMSFEGPVCEMLYYGILPSVRREFDKIFERYGLYYEFGHHWNFSCYYI